MQIYKTNRKVQGLPKGTELIRLWPVEANYKGTISVDYIDPCSQDSQGITRYHLPRSRLDLVYTG